MVTKIRIARVNAIVSDLNPDDLANYEIAHRLQDDTDDQHGVPDRIGKQRPDEQRVHEIHPHNDDGRHAHQQQHGEAALRGVDTYLAQDLEALADHVREIIENLGEVAAGLALQHYGRDKEFHVDERYAVDQVAECFAHGQAEFLFLEELAKLGGHGFGDLVGNHFERGGEGVSGAYSAGQRVDGLGEQFLKFVETLGALVVRVGVGQEASQQESDPGEQQNLVGGKVDDEGHQEAGDAAEEYEVSGAGLYVGLGKHFLQGRDAIGPAQQGVEGRDLAEHFVAQQRDVFERLGFAGFAAGGKAVAEHAGLRLTLVQQRKHDERTQRDDYENQNSDQSHRVNLCLRVSATGPLLVKANLSGPAILWHGRHD